MKLLRVSEKLRVTLSQYIKNHRIDKQSNSITHRKRKEREKKLKIKKLPSPFLSQRPSPSSFLRSGSGSFPSPFLRSFAIIFRFCS
jgi:hypothetical protein